MPLSGGDGEVVPGGAGLGRAREGPQRRHDVEARPRRRWCRSASSTSGPRRRAPRRPAERRCARRRPGRGRSSRTAGPPRPSMLARSVRCWPGSNRYSSRRLSRHGEGDGHGVVGEALDACHGERVELGAAPRRARGGEQRHQMALNSSKGSRQARQRRSALHAVEPKRATSSVSVLTALRAGHQPALKGQRPPGPPQPGPRPGPPAGRCRTRAAARGPASRHPVGGPRRASGARCTSHVKPAAAASCSMRRSIAPIAGQPEYVGVISTRTGRRASSTSTSRRMPRSSMVTTGTSGSGMSRDRLGPTRVSS